MDQKDIVHSPSSETHSLKQKLVALWHLSDSFSWMSPLPFPHRRGVLIAAAVVAIAYLWPGETIPPISPQLEDNATVIRAELVPPPAQPQTTITPTPTEPAALVEQTEVAPQPASTSATTKKYNIQKQGTLTQLFRDNNLPLRDIFAMAAIEGSQKPLSALYIGQQVEISLGSQGEVMQLIVDTPNGQKVQFNRQADGSYRKSR